MENGFAQVEEVPFKTNALRGIAYIAQNDEENNVIVLNSSQTPEEQNFYCAHEMIHISIHKNEDIQTFQCFDRPPRREEYLEWQANQGGAELVVPYRELLPLIKENPKCYSDFTAYQKFRFAMTQYFKVSDNVIKVRFEDLKYEIAQYVNGVPLEEIEILSKTAQLNRGLRIRSITDMATEEERKRGDAIYFLRNGYFPPGREL